MVLHFLGLVRCLKQPFLMFLEASWDYLKLLMQLVREQDWNKDLVSDWEVKLSRVVGWDGKGENQFFDTIQYFQ